MGTTRRKSGVLAGEVEPYRDWLTERGYTPGSIRLLLRNLSHLGVWLAARGLPESAICTDSVHAMFGERRRQGRRLVPGERGATGLLGFLRERGLLVEGVHGPSRLEQLLTRFHAWLVDERNLAASTVLRNENTARRFLTEQAVHGARLDVAALRARMSTRSCCGSSRACRLVRRKVGLPSCGHC